MQRNREETEQDHPRSVGRIPRGGRTGDDASGHLVSSLCRESSSLHIRVRFRATRLEKPKWSFGIRWRSSRRPMRTSSFSPPGSAQKWIDRRRLSAAWRS